MCQCRCMQSRRNNNSQLVSNNVAQVSQANNLNNNNNHGCRCGRNLGLHCNDPFCMLKSYLEEIQGWEDVVRPCSNYHHHHPWPHNDDEEETTDLTDSVSTLTDTVSNLTDSVSNLLGDMNLTEQLGIFPQLLGNLNLQDMIGQILNQVPETSDDPENLEETVFE